MITTKQIFGSCGNTWIITRIIQGNRCVRIDARTKFYRAAEQNYFSKWVSVNYANRLSVKYFGKKISEMNNFQY